MAKKCTNMAGVYVFSVLSLNDTLVFKKYKTCTAFLSSYRNRSESLGEWEMLWGQVFPQLFRVLPNFHECFSDSISNTKNMFSISFRKYRDTKKIIIKMSILFACPIIMSTAHASSMILSSYRNTVLNQSAPVFAWAIF